MMGVIQTAARWGAVGAAMLGIAPVARSLARVSRGAVASSYPAYDAAGTGHRLTGWDATSSGVNSLVIGNAATVRRRARDMTRKSPYADQALDRYVSNAIGTGIHPRSMHPDPKKREEIQEAWRRWVDEADADNAANFYGLQSLAVRAMVESGDVFGRMRARRPDDGLSVPLQVELAESDMVPLDMTRPLVGGAAIRGGVEFDAIKNRTAYHMYREHPGESLLFGGGAMTVRVPARYVTHVFRPLRPGQIRGISSLAPVLVSLYEFDQLNDAMLVRQKIAAMLTGFIEQVQDEGGGSGLPGATADTSDTGVEIAKLEPGTFQMLRPNEKAWAMQMPDVGANQTDFQKQILRGIAAGSGVTYEQLTGDLSGVNYSSIRAGLLEFRREIEQYQHCFFIYQFCRPIWRRWVRDAILVGAIDAPDFAQYPNRYLDVQWVPQGWKWVDPLKEVQALIKAIRAGLISRTEAARMSGYDPEVIDRHMADDNARADEMGLKYDSDGRNPANGGSGSTVQDRGADREEDQ